MIATTLTMRECYSRTRINADHETDRDYIERESKGTE